MISLYGLAYATCFFASIFAALQYMNMKQLLVKAWVAKKRLRTLFIVFLLGPVVWILIIWELLPIIISVLSMLILQETPDHLETNERMSPPDLPNIRRKVSNDQESDN